MLYPHLNGKRVILASQSPRRLELVKGLELEPVTWLKDVDESFPEEITGPAIAEYVTRLKAEAYWDELGPNDVLITGDTVVLPQGWAGEWNIIDVFKFSGKMAFYSRRVRRAGDFI